MTANELTDVNRSHGAGGGNKSKVQDKIIELDEKDEEDELPFDETVKYT
jgi:hypothetical protein